MTEDDVSAVTDMWARESRAAELELPWSEIESALRLLPKSDACAVSQDAATLLLLGPTDVVFTISAEGGKARVVSRPLNGERLRVSLEWSEPAPGTRTTRWDFSYEGEPGQREPWQTVSGSVSVDRGTGREDVDERELFARMLASRAGWPSYAQPVARDEPVEERAAPTAEPAEPRHKRLTDVWGRPLDTRRH
jgi:hypothetical protein